MDALLAWHHANGGYLHPSTGLNKDAAKGCHLEAKDHLPDGTTIVTVPHSMALSCLNAIVDDSLPVLKANADSFSVEALGVFYLMAQWINKDTSFYRPFLDILQSPEQGFNTPHWFDEADMSYLQGTDLAPNFEARRATWHRYWRDGTAILANDGMDVSQYTWDLCKWAATVFTSRSLSSRAVRPTDTPYWTAYKQGPNGRQTVLLDFSKVSEDRKDFPVLIPVMDCLNHHHDAHVDWRFEQGRFELSLASALFAGSEVLNNYGPKSNSELLLGYGFCVPNNPNDCVYQALRPPPGEVLSMLRTTHAGYFKTDGTWNPDATIFKLAAWRPDSLRSVWESIPTELVELFYYIVRYNRGFSVEQIESNVGQYLLSGMGRHYLPSIATMILGSLPPKYGRILAADEELPSEPRNDKQRYAKIYRDGQRDILESLQLGLGQYLAGLLARAGDTRGALFSLGDAVEQLQSEGGDLYQQCRNGLAAVLGSPSMAAEDDPEAEFNAWVLWLCFSLVHSRSIDEGSTADTSLLGRELRQMKHDYLQTPTLEDGEGEDDPEMNEWRDLLEKAATAMSASRPVDAPNPWTGSGWSAKLLLDLGVRVVSSQSVTLELDETGPHVYLYMHADPPEDARVP